MNSFKKRTAVRIAAISIFLAAVASPIAWLVSQELAEQATVSLAIEETRRLLRHFDANELGQPNAKERAIEAAETISSGIFDVFEIYDGSGTKLASAMSEEGKAIESLLPKHGRPDYTSASYLSVKLDDNRWILRVFVPLQAVPDSNAGKITGYFEGVRVVPEWQHQQLITNALSTTLMVVLASLLCGAVIYPVVVHLSVDNDRQAREVLDSHISIMEALGRAVAKRDSDTGAHNYRVAWIAARIAKRLGLSDVEMQSLIIGSFLHDVGKIGISDTILLKPGKLDDEELRIMRTHVMQGEEIVSGISWLDGAYAVVAGHHEKWNGSGYPRQLIGEAIPLAARIFSVADVFDALCSKRPYKEPMGFDAAMAILNKDTGSHFDPRVMAAFSPIAREVFDRLSVCDENEVRELLDEQIQSHFAA